MAKLYLVILVLAATAVSGQIATTPCSLDQKEIQMKVMECMGEEPGLMLQVIGHMENPEYMATTNFVCENQKGVVDLMMCMENKIFLCFPSVKDVLTQYLPTRDRWQDGIKFLCDHKTDSIETKCFNQNQVQEFIRCNVGKLSNAFQSNQRNDMKKVMCNAIRGEEQCFVENHGTCSQAYVKLFIQFLDKLFPECSPLTSDTKNQVISDVFSQMLVHGQPLMYQPKGNVQYRVVN